MKQRTLTLVAVALVGAALAFTTPNSAFAADKKVKAQQKVATIYSCPMHPEVASEKPGKCPKCGMNLEAKQVAPRNVAPRQVAKAAAYICPMHPEVTSDKPGKCSKCGMNLEQKQTSRAAQGK